MNKHSLYIIIINIAFVLLANYRLEGQTGSIQGTVIDSITGETMSYVNIAVIGSTYGTVSNQNGEFKINPDKTNQSDSLAFHYIGYKTLIKPLNELKDGVLVKMQEEEVKLKEITILAKPVTVQELINNALYRRGSNYPDIIQRMEVFKRRNTATYIDDFNLSVIKSDIKNIDTSFIQTVVDSMPRYNRSYQDNLYTLYSFPKDSLKKKNKVRAIKRVILEEDDGGELEQVEKILMSTLNGEKGDKTFWKLKTGILSLKVDDTDDYEPSDTSKIYQQKLDTIAALNPKGLYRLTNSMNENWNFEFIRKPDRYKYEIEGIVPIGDEYAYAISFTGRMRGDYQGMLYISDETYAFLRIEYSIKNRRKTGGFRLLGISHNELIDSGLLIYTRDEHGYYLKYSMSNISSSFGINRAFSMIKKKKRPIIRKKLNEIELDIDLAGWDDGVRETLVVFREKIDQDTFTRTVDKGVKPEKITSYSDSIWQGYSIIEPTKAMKEYRVKR